MERRTLCVAFLVLVAGQATAAVDYTCLNRCTGLNYQYAYCMEVCSYGQTPTPTPTPVYGRNPALTEAISRGMQVPDLTGVRMQAEALRIQREQLRMQQEQAEAQRRLIEEQTRAQQIENSRPRYVPTPSLTDPGQTYSLQAYENCMSMGYDGVYCTRQYLAGPSRSAHGGSSGSPPDASQSGGGTGPQYSEADKAIYMRWLQAVEPRRQLYGDFDTVVFAKDLHVTMSMLDLMASSPYAADMTYYLGKNKARSQEIAGMPLLQQAAAIREIEIAVAKK